MISQGRKSISDEGEQFLRRELTGSGILPETAAAAGIRIEEDVDKIAQYLHCRRSTAKSFGPCIVFPLLGENGLESGVFQLKPLCPQSPGRKYETPKGQHGGVLRFSIAHRHFIDDPTIPIVLTEGCKKGMAIAQCGYAVITLPGVFNWQVSRQGDKTKEREIVDALSEIVWQGRKITILFDTDDRRNPGVHHAESELARILEQHGAVVSITRPLVEYDPETKSFRKYGADDYLVAKGEDALRKLIDSAFDVPPTVTLDQFRAEIKTVRERIRGVSGVYLDGTPTGGGKSHADSLEIPHYKTSLTAVPSHEQAQELQEKYRAAGINAAAYPELAECTRRECRRDRCWRFKYGPDACVKNRCEHFEKVSLALKTGFAPSEVICPVCDDKDGCEYKRLLNMAENAKHRIATHKRVELSCGAVTKKAKYIAIHENSLGFIRPQIVLNSKNIPSLRKIIDTARKLPSPGIYTDNDRRLFAWRLAESAESMIDALENATQSHQMQLSSDANRQGHMLELFRMIEDSEIEESEALRACVLAITDGLADPPFVSVSASKPETSARIAKITLIPKIHLPSDATVIFADASADAQALREATGIDFIDITPIGSVENVGRIVQITADLTLSNRSEKALAMFRGVLARFPDAQKIGLITHRKFTNYILENVSDTERERIRKVDHFRGTASRGSNAWTSNDLLIVLGTPRVPSSAIEAELIRSGHIDAIKRVQDCRKENWGIDYWSGRTESGQRVTVRSKGYRDHHWHAAHRRIVAEELRQCVGRARAVCSNGVPNTVIVSTENLDYPLADFDILPITGPTLANWANIFSAYCEANAVCFLNIIYKKQTALTPTEKVNFPIGSLGTLTTRVISERIGKSLNAVRDQLPALAAASLIEKVGERSGWRLTFEHVRRFLSVGGGPALLSKISQNSNHEKET